MKSSPIYRKLFLGIVILGLIQGIGMAQSTNLSVYQEFQGDYANTSIVQANFTGHFRLKWLSNNTDINVEDYYAPKSSPVIMNETVYIGDDSGEVHAFSLLNGTRLWSKKISNYTGEEPHDSHGIHSTPCLVKGNVIIGTHEGYIYSLKGTDGEVMWKYGPIGGAITSSVHYFANKSTERFYFSGNDGVVYCLGPDGSEIWKTPLSTSAIHSSVALDTNRGILCVGSNDYKIYALSMDSGAILWNFATNREVKASPTVDNATDRVYIGSFDGKMYCLDITTGQKIWDYKTDDYIQSSAGLDTVHSRLIFAGYDERIYCLNTTSGGEIWTYKMSNKAISSPVIDPKNKFVIIGNHDGFVLCLGEERGNIKWTYPTGGRITSSVAVSGKYLVVSSSDGHLYCFEAFTPMPSYWGEAFLVLAILAGGVMIWYFFFYRKKHPIQDQTESQNKEGV